MMGADDFVPPSPDDEGKNNSHEPDELNKSNTDKPNDADDAKDDGDDGKNFGKQFALFPLAQLTSGLTAPIFPELSFAKALLFELMMGRELTRHSFRPRSLKITNTDVSTIARGIRRDNHIPIASQLKRVRIYSPDCKSRFTTRLGHFFMTDEQRYHFEVAFPDWQARIGNDKFDKRAGKKTTKYQRNLLEKNIFENGKVKNLYPRFFSHDPNFVLPATWVAPELR
jgi:hypothetical protein